MDLTGTPCLGNSFKNKSKCDAAETPDYLSTGFLCPNYSRSGNHTGDAGSTGRMFVQQAALILHMKANTIQLEMSDYAFEVNNGCQVQDIISQLSTVYHLYAVIIPVWQHGDISNRSRLFIIGTLKADTEADYMSDIKFKFPEPTISAADAGIYRMIDVPDAEVPEEYWLRMNHHVFPGNHLKAAKCT